MMISYKSLLDEIEVHLANAKNTEDEQQIREQLTAIRALCNVGLANNQISKPTTKSVSLNQSNTSPSQSQSIINSVSSLNASKLTENDANGDSIFDF